jgi:hypothetical protein
MNPKTIDISIEFPAPPQDKEEMAVTGFAALAADADGAVGSRILRNGASWTGVVEFDDPAKAAQFCAQLQRLTGNYKPVTFDVKPTVN